LQKKELFLAAFEKKEQRSERERERAKIEKSWPLIGMRPRRRQSIGERRVNQSQL